MESNLDYETCVSEEDLKPTYPELPSFTPNSSDVTLFKMLADGIVNSMKKDAVQSLSQVVMKTISEEPDFSIRYYGIPYNLSTKSQQIRTQKRFSDQEDHGNGWRDSPTMNRKIE